MGRAVTSRQEGANSARADLTFDEVFAQQTWSDTRLIQCLEWNVVVEVATAGRLEARTAIVESTGAAVAEAATTVVVGPGAKAASAAAIAAAEAVTTAIAAAH